jgi:hypothetical protein
MKKHEEDNSREEKEEDVFWTECIKIKGEKVEIIMYDLEDSGNFLSQRVNKALHWGMGEGRGNNCL